MVIELYIYPDFVNSSHLLLLVQVPPLLPVIAQPCKSDSVLNFGSSFSDIVVLMDMPGIYLPPQLQSRLLEYVRFVVKENENIQFIIVTSSSALIDKATTEELVIINDILLRSVVERIQLLISFLELFFIARVSVVQ